MSESIPDNHFTAIKDKEHLKRWLRAGDRQYLVIDAVEMVDALPWPDGVDSLMQLIDCYKQHRSVTSTGLAEVMDGVAEPVAVMRDDRLTPDEVDAAIAQLLRHKTALLEEYSRRGLVEHE